MKPAFNCLASGAWIFVYRSHSDFEKLRLIPNERERRGHNPLLFFLKCLEADDARLSELILKQETREME